MFLGQIDEHSQAIQENFPKQPAKFPKKDKEVTVHPDLPIITDDHERILKDWAVKSIEMVILSTVNKAVAAKAAGQAPPVQRGTMGYMQDIANYYVWCYRDTPEGYVQSIKNWRAGRATLLKPEDIEGDQEEL